MAELGPAPKGGGGQGNRSRAQTRVWERRPVARCALADQKGRRSLLCDCVREASLHSAAHDGGQDGGGTRRPEGLGKVGRWRTLVGEGGGTCRKIIPAWLDGQHH
jgi:hypothetical protein